MLLRPFVLINVAATVDGKIDTVERRGTRISSPRDRERVDRLRAQADAIMVGPRTLRDEDPRLTVRSAALRAERLARGLSEHPAKVAILPATGLRPDARFLVDGPARIILFTTSTVAPEQIAALQRPGVELYPCDAPRVDLAAALATLKRVGIERLVVEGGGTLNFELLRQGLVDEVHLYLAPLIFGGASAPSLADGAGLAHDAAVLLERTHVEAWEDGGIVLCYRLRRPGR